MKTMGEIYPAILLAIDLLFGSNAKVQAEQIGWLLRTDTRIGVEEIAGGTAPSGSMVYIWNGAGYDVATKTSGGWPPIIDVYAGGHFVFEWAGGGNDEYLGWPYAYVGDWRLTAPAVSSVSGDVSIEWSAFNTSNIAGNPVPNYAARVKMEILLGTTTNLVEDLGLIWETESVVWHSQAADNGTYIIDVTIVDSPIAGGEGLKVASITKEITLDNSDTTLEVSVSEITETVAEGNSPANRTFEVWGTGALNYSISDNVAWLSCSPISGSSSGEHDSITVSFDSDGLPVGSHTGLISVVSSEASNSPETIGVVLNVEIAQIGWLLRTSSDIGVTNITTAEVSFGSKVYVFNGTSYDVSEYNQLFVPGVGFVTKWNPNNLVINAGEQFVFEWAGGGNEEYLGWPYAYVGDWRLTAPADATVSDDVLIEWAPLQRSNIAGNPAPSYAVRVIVTGAGGYEEDLGLIWATESVVWHSQTALNGDYSINISIVDFPAAGVEGVEVASITKQIILNNSGVLLATSITEMAVEATEGYSPTNRTFEVWGSDSLSYTISDNVDWLSCSPTSGSSSGEHDAISVSFDSAGLPVGSYTGLISIASAEASNSPQTIEVVFGVEPIALGLSVSEITEAVPAGGSPANRIFEVWGTGALTYSISDNVAWLSCSPIGGSSSGEHDSVTISYDSDGLPVGSYTGLISVVSSEASNSPETIGVVLNVEIAQIGWLLRTSSDIGVTNITTAEVSFGSKVYVFNGTSYDVSEYNRLFVPGVGFVTKWNPNNLVINAGEQFVFEWAGGGNEEYLGWPYAYVGDWRLTAPANATVSGDVLIEWEPLQRSNITGNLAPSYAARVIVTGAGGYEEDLGLIWATESVVWHSQTALNGDYSINISIVDFPAAGVEGGEVASIVKQVYLFVNPVDGQKTETIDGVTLDLLPDSLYVGSNTFGNAVIVTNGGIVRNDNGFIGYETSASSNWVVVTGAGSEWSNSGGLYVGGSTSVAGGIGNSATVTNGGSVSASSVTVYAGNVLHLQNGGTLTVTGDFDAGQGGFDYAGGSLEIGGSLSGLSELPSGNRLEVVEVAGDLTVYGIFSPGSSSGGTAPQIRGMVALAESGVGAVINGALTLEVGGSLEMELGGYEVGTEYDHLAITGLATLEGTLDVVLVDGFMPTGNTSFDLFDWAGGISGSFVAVNLPSIPFGLLWNTNGLYSMGEVSVELSMVDSDVDGMVDSWEYLNFGGNVSPTGNPDIDPHGNLEEYIAGTDPDNAVSYLSITNVALGAAGFVVQWDPPVSNRLYSVLWNSSLTNGFQTLETEIEFPQNSYTDTVNAAGSEGFYRVDVQLK